MDLRMCTAWLCARRTRDRPPKTGEQISVGEALLGVDFRCKENTSGLSHKF